VFCQDNICQLPQDPHEDEETIKFAHPFVVGNTVKAKYRGKKSKHGMEGGRTWSPGGAGGS
jgi:hypothetical protein